MRITTEIQYLVLIHATDSDKVIATGGLFVTPEQAQAAIDELRRDYFANHFEIQPLEVNKVGVIEFYPEEPEEDRCECLGCESHTRCMRSVIGYCGGCGVYHGNPDEDLCGRCKI